MLRVNTNFPGKRGSQEAWASRSRRQGRIQTFELLPGWLSSLRLNITVAVAAVFLEHLGSQEHLGTLFSALSSGVLGCQSTAGLHPNLT